MKNKKFDLKNLYGVDYINKPNPEYSQTVNFLPKSKTEKIVNQFMFHVFQKLSIESVIKEITFSFIAFITLIYMQYTNKIGAIGDYGIIIQIALTFACFFNLLKASTKSLSPGLFCVLFGAFLLNNKFHITIFNFITADATNFIIGAGAFFIAISLLKSDS